MTFRWSSPEVCGSMADGPMTQPKRVSRWNPLEQT